ncbi:nicotinamide riboside transporter PnuC [Flammeovirga sp. SubArs3]|uniref:nicotinamide riboside transporter PnuC n=1 Tax=Flammeovirga sp. SubArs3 TaxID=2995316 RepID=UPI00248D28C0|nr:nicotinamide riboside transporter PnuC [Flammeovirga sp. SubArs3]
MSSLELIAVIFSITFTVLAIKENIWCWAASTISVSIYMYLCITAKLYAETGLQIFYLIMNVVGFYQWKFKRKDQEILQLSEWSLKTHFILFIIGGIGIYILASGLLKYTDAALPFVDSFTTVFSIIATFMVTRKIVSNWLYWIVIDAISVYMYYIKGFQLTSFLFIVYTLLAVWGYYQWRTEYGEKYIDHRA